MTLFRPCIDLHEGSVKQIVGGTLEAAPGSLRTNFVSQHGAAYFAELYRADKLVGGHVIQLGPGNMAAAEGALKAWPHGLQIGGGVNAANARHWLERGASKVIVTSWLFPEGTLAPERLKELGQVASPSELVIDLSCRRRGDRWFVATNKWQTVTDVELNSETLALFAPFCSEFLIHAADVEGLCRGVDEELVAALGRWTSVPVTYAGGGRILADLTRVSELSHGHVDLTFGSALDIFGGAGLRYADCVAYNHAQS